MSNSSIFDDFKQADVKLDLSAAAAQVTDDEMKAGAVELIVCGVTRELIEGGVSNKPLEVWHAFGKSARGKLVPRTFRGRAQIARDLRFHAMDRELKFVNLATGEESGAPGDQGAWSLVTAKGEPAAMAIRVSLDTTKGRAAQQGRGFAYKLEACGLVMAQVKATYPQLSSIDIGGTVTALPHDVSDDTADDDAHHSADELPTRGEPVGAGVGAGADAGGKSSKKKGGK